MSSNGEGLRTNPLLGSVDSLSAGTTKTIPNSQSDQDKSLNDNGFSQYLGRQKAAQQGESDARARSATATGQGQSSSDGSGKSLPQSDQALPSARSATGGISTAATNELDASQGLADQSILNADTGLLSSLTGEEAIDAEARQLALQALPVQGWKTSGDGAPNDGGTNPGASQAHLLASDKSAINLEGSTAEAVTAEGDITAASLADGSISQGGITKGTLDVPAQPLAGAALQSEAQGLSAPSLTAAGAQPTEPAAAGLAGITTGSLDNTAATSAAGAAGTTTDNPAATGLQAVGSKFQQARGAQLSATSAAQSNELAGGVKPAGEGAGQTTTPQASVVLSASANAAQMSSSDGGAQVSSMVNQGFTLQAGQMASSSSGKTTAVITAETLQAAAKSAEVSSRAGVADSNNVSPLTVAGTTSATATAGQANLSASYSHTESLTAQAFVPVTVGKPGWSDSVMQRVMWMSSQQIHRAEIALDPPELGPLHVKISTQGEHTSVVFSSAHGAVRDALDQGLPRLRDMLESQGLDLADVDVSDQGASEQQSESSESGEAQGHSIAAGGDEIVEDQAPAESLAPVSLALVDQYI